MHEHVPFHYVAVRGGGPQVAVAIAVAVAYTVLLQDAETKSARSGEHSIATAASATAKARPVVWAAFRPVLLHEARRAAAEWYGMARMVRYATAVSCMQVCVLRKDDVRWDRPQI